jgi:uncharacterized protein
MGSAAMFALQRLMLAALFACCGVVALQPSEAQAAEASFDCAKAQSDTEWAICNTPTLAAWDVRMAALYAQRSSDPGARQGQRDWIRIKRNPCVGNVGCLMDAYEVRLRDLEGPKAAQLKLRPVPAGLQSNACASSDLSIIDTDKGDAGMSKATRAFLIRYTGRGSCVLRGYPSLTVYDSSGAVRIGYPNYSTAGYYVRFPGQPKTVTLSAQSRDAWFSFSTSSGCDAHTGKSDINVDVSLPFSSKPIRRISLQYVTCQQVTVTPIGAITTMDAALSP